MTTTKNINGLNILLVDDESFVRKVNATVFSGLTGSDVLESDSARHALAVLKTKPIDLMVTDIQMPEMNGLELMKEIRCGRAGIAADLPILVITSFSNTEVLGSSMGLDVNGFLVKPLSPKNALEKINKAINERITLRTELTYDRVMTNLQSLSDSTDNQKQGNVNAAISMSRADTDSSRDNQNKWIEVSSGGLRPGMQLVDDIHTRDGRVLLTTGQVLTDSMINRIHELHSVIAMGKFRVLPPQTD